MRTAAFNVTAAPVIAATAESANSTGYKSDDGSTVGAVKCLNVWSFAELVIALLFMSAWAASITVFLRKWRHLRIVLPSFDGFRRRSPKNLETVRVIRQDDKSVIYWHYPRHIVSNIQV
jgi:hypothetical protein